jgi:hypothetical protein
VPDIPSLRGSGNRDIYFIKNAPAKYQSSIRKGDMRAAPSEAGLNWPEPPGGEKSAETHNYHRQKHRSGSFELHIAHFKCLIVRWKNRLTQSASTTLVRLFTRHYLQAMDLFCYRPSPFKEEPA